MDLTSAAGNHSIPVPSQALSRSVKQIAGSMFASHQTIANQLKILRDYRYVRGNERGREVLYGLAEPLMRLALQIKETQDRQPLRLSVDFMRVVV